MLAEESMDDKFADAGEQGGSGRLQGLCAGFALIL